MIVSKSKCMSSLPDGTNHTGTATHISEECHEYRTKPPLSYLSCRFIDMGAYRTQMGKCQRTPCRSVKRRV